MFSTYIPDRTLATICRGLATMLDAGVPVLKALRTSSKNAGHPRAVEALADVARDVQNGVDFATALEGDPRFPPLAAEMMGVAERTGQLPEILRGLADHYENLVKTRRQFYGVIAWPIFQLVAAILVIGLMIFVIGMIATSQGGEPIDVLGLGLTGSRGALIWFALTFGGLAGIWLLIKFLSSNLAGKKTLDTLVLRIPVLGNCLRSFAIARFSWAMSLTQQTGMGIDECCEVSMKAASNGAFLAEIPRVVAMVRAGEELSTALAATGLFPASYIEMIDIADTSGTVPETLQRISPELEADARRKLSALAVTAGVAIWVAVAVIIILLIVRLALFYVGTITNALP